MDKPRTYFTDHELFTASVVADFLFVRHGHHSNGRLTPEGIDEIKQEVKEIADLYREEKVQPYFFLFYSPSLSFLDGTALGCRAKHSAEVFQEEMRETVIRTGLPYGLDGELQSCEALSEPDYFYVNGSINPRGYFDALVEKFGKKREEGFFSVPSDLEPIRTSTGAESAVDVGWRLFGCLRSIWQQMNTYREKCPGKRPVFVLFTHGDGIRCMAQYPLEFDSFVWGWQPRTGEAIHIQLSQGDGLRTYVRGIPKDAFLREEICQLTLKGNLERTDYTLRKSRS